MANPQEWYESLPPVTKVWLTSSVVVSLAAKFGMLNPMSLALDWSSVLKSFQIWRIPGNVAFFGSPSFPWLMQMFMMSRFVPAYEHDPFPSGGGTHRGNIADVVFMLLFGFAVLSPVAYFMNLYFLSISLFYMVIYVWSRRHPEERTTFYMFQVPALYLPWVMVGFSFIVGGNPILDLVGIGAGHLYYFVQQELPNLDTPLKNSKLLHTPMFLYNLFGVEPTYASAANVRLQERAAGGVPRATGGHAWGTGRRLVD